jgi:hypothetical protein
VFTGLFPESITSHYVSLYLTDGLLTTEVELEFRITPVDDPPTISPLGSYTAIEDQPSVLNLTPYLQDVDTPVEDLSIIVRSPRCTVVGHDLQFHYARGGFNETITVQVTDGRTMVEADLEVWVEERNDRPIVHPIGPRVFKEDEEDRFDLTEYIEDEDTSFENMTVSCDHESLVGIDHLTLVFKFLTWQPEETIYFNVSDGMLKGEGQFLAQVQEVNDAPVIESIGDFFDPVVIEINEDSLEEFEVLVSDEDDHNFKYALSTSWSGITVTTEGVIQVEAVKGDVGHFSALLLVEDADKASDSWNLTVTVLNVNDPPSMLLIQKPSNHTVMDQGLNVSFSVQVDDPDMRFGQQLTVTWLSNISGPFMTRTSEEDLGFLKNDLPVGIHNITVRVSDGEFVLEAWIVLEIVEPYVPPPPEPEKPFLETTSGLGLMLGVIIAVVVVALLVVTRSRRKDVEPESPSSQPAEDPVIVMDVVEGSHKYSSEMESLGEELGKLADELEATKESPTDDTPALSTPAAIVPEAEDMTQTSEETQAEREHAVKVREVMRSLTQLPRGLPSSLIDHELSDLALVIVDGPKRQAPNGTTLVEVDGKWYTADHRRTSTFLQLWKDDSTTYGDPDDERQRKLEQLEERLLDGSISEETYERLRKKYE